MNNEVATNYLPDAMNPGFKLMSPLGIAILVSLVFHAVVLSVKFVPPMLQALKASDSPLEVVLVNAKSQSRPAKAEALAQANLDGGGNAKEGLMATPLPPTLSNREGEAIIETHKKIEQLEEQKRKLLTGISKESPVLDPETDKKNETEPPKESGQDLIERARQMARVDGAIERNSQLKQKEPRRAQVSANTTEAVYAMYYAQLRERIEKRGTLNFPQVNGKKLYGELVLSIIISPDGRIKQIDLVKSSGQAELDKRAQAIVNSAAPFGHFSADIASEYDELEVISKFKFTREDALETSSQSRAK